MIAGLYLQCSNSLVTKSYIKCFHLLINFLPVFSLMDSRHVHVNTVECFWHAWSFHACIPLPPLTSICTPAILPHGSGSMGG